MIIKKDVGVTNLLRENKIRIVKFRRYQPLGTLPDQSKGIYSSGSGLCYKDENIKIMGTRD